MSRALDGGPLLGDKLVRLVYLDESGTGNINVEPFVVVSAVIIDGDKQLKAIETRLIELADKFAIPEDRDEFVFHAYELYTGGKAEFKKKYSLLKRHKYLRKLCAIPKEFELPVCLYAIDRRKVPRMHPQCLPNEYMEVALMHASVCSGVLIDRFMEAYAPKDEYAMLVFEENGKFSKRLREYHNFFRSPMVEKVIREQIEPRGKAGIRRYTRIAETLMFSGKRDSSLLQVADACAYIANRKIRGAELDPSFWTPIHGNLIPCHKAFNGSA